MSKLIIKNKANETLRIMLEPQAVYYDVEAGEKVEVIGDFQHESNVIHIDFFSESAMSLWVPFETTVSKDGVPLSPAR